MSDFKPGTVGYYETQNVEEIEDFDQDQYGNTWYNVKFVGDADTFMWLAKNKPEEGKKYYGHLEPTKSGKRLRFKTDKVPEGSTPGKPVADYEPSTNARWAIGMAYRAFVSTVGSPEDASGDFPFEVVELHAKKLVEMFDKIRNGNDTE